MHPEPKSQPPKPPSPWLLDVIFTNGSHVMNAYSTETEARHAQERLRREAFVFDTSLLPPPVR